jgi:hypothetical protein
MWIKHQDKTSRLSIRIHIRILNADEILGKITIEHQDKHHDNISGYNMRIGIAHQDNTSG